MQITGERKEKEKLSASLWYVVAHFGFLCSNIVCLHLSTTKQTKGKSKHAWKYSLIYFSSYAVVGHCHFPCKGVHEGQSVLSYSLQKRQCCVETCCEMTGSSLSLTGAGKTSKHPPNPLRRRRISTCKMTGTALSKVFQVSAKGSLPKTTDVQRS